MPQRSRLVLVEIRATSADTAALDFAFDRLAFSPLLAASTPLSNLFLRDLNENSVDRSRVPSMTSGDCQRMCSWVEQHAQHDVYGLTTWCGKPGSIWPCTLILVLVNFCQKSSRAQVR